MEYYQYFRLRNAPFQPTSPDGVVYFSPTHLEGLATLEAGLTSEQSGLTMLTGEVGTGKTTLIYSLLKRDYKRVRIAYIDNPKFSFLEMMRDITMQLKLYCPGTTKLDYLNALDHLLELHGDQERIAIVVDEAQALSDDTLEELRLLSNRGQSKRLKLQLILVGQPELAERLKRPELRQLNQRISSRGVLKPLTLEQGAMYVECKLNAQGGKCSAIFEPGALNQLLRSSDGLPRKINVLCHNAMQAAFYASDRKVSLKLARKIAAKYDESVGRRRRLRARILLMPAVFASGALASVVALAFIYPHLITRWFRPTPQVAHAPAASTTSEARGRESAPPVPGRHERSNVKRDSVNSLVPRPADLRAAQSTGSAIPVSTTSASSDSPLTEEAAQPSAHPGPAEVKPVPDKTEPQRRQVAVREGDTLEKMALHYLGSEDAMRELVKANPQISDINQLAIGQLIYLPAGVDPKAADQQTTATQPLTQGEPQ